MPSYAPNFAPPHLCNLSLLELQQHAAASITSFMVVQQELRDRHLRMLYHFFEDPESVFRYLGVRRAVISGSFALNYLLGDAHWSPNDIDFYIPVDGMDAMRQFVVAECGYTEIIIPSRTDAVATQVSSDINYLSLFGESGIRDVARFQKGSRRLDVICSCSKSPLYPITRFWSTLQMNYLSPKGFCCAYPELTFGRKGVLNTATMSPNGVSPDPVIALIKKYTARGFDILNDWSTLGQDVVSFAGHGSGDTTIARSFDDKLSFTGSYGLRTWPTSGVPYHAFGPSRTVSAWRVKWVLAGEKDGHREPCAAWVLHHTSGKMELV